MQRLQMKKPVQNQTANFVFSVISDIQYANIDDGTNYKKTRSRYYRATLDKLRSAINYWNSMNLQKPSFLLQLGDIIDGKCKGVDQSETSLSSVLRIINEFPGPIHHHIGNHEMYNFSSKFLLQSELNSALQNGVKRDDKRSYYAFYPDDKSCFIVLNTYEICLMDKDSEGYNIAETTLRNIHTLNESDDWASGNKLVGLDKRFMAYNGAVSETQLEWLRETLEKAEQEQRWVIVSSHSPLKAADITCMTWSTVDILDLLHKHNNIVAVFAGHDHDGEYHRDEHGIHHITLPGIIEAPPETTDFGTVYVYDDRIELIGEGRLENITIRLPQFS